MNLPSAIIDSHVHLWNPGGLRYAWLDDLAELNRAFMPEHFAAATAAANVTKMIFVECGCDSNQTLEEVDWVSTLAKSEPRLRGIVANVALEKGAAVRSDLEKLAARPLVKGIRRLLQGEADANFCLRPEFVVGVKLLAEFNFSFDLCLRHDQLCSVTELVKRSPQVEFMLDHFGKPPVGGGKMEPWATELKSLASLPNVACKISGLTTEADLKNWKPEQLKPFFETALEAFGFDRVLFGSDWPVCTLATNYQRWLELVLEMTSSASEVERKKLFYDNAEKFYRI